jgi:hypothetical protein
MKNRDIILIMAMYEITCVEFSEQSGISKYDLKTLLMGSFLMDCKGFFIINDFKELKGNKDRVADHRSVKRLLGLGYVESLKASRLVMSYGAPRRTSAQYGISREGIYLLECYVAAVKRRVKRDIKAANK